MAEAKRIICVGHAALDRIYRIEAFPAQPTKVRALEYMEAGGGMAANAAVAIARLGGRAELWSRIGDDTAGSTIRAGLKAEHVDVRYVQSFEGRPLLHFGHRGRRQGRAPDRGAARCGYAVGYRLVAARAREGSERRPGRSEMAGGRAHRVRARAQGSGFRLCSMPTWARAKPCQGC